MLPPTLPAGWDAFARGATENVTARDGAWGVAVGSPTGDVTVRPREGGDTVSDKEMERLPERSVSGVNRKTALRTFVSGLVSDLGPILRRFWHRVRRR